MAGFVFVFVVCFLLSSSQAQPESDLITQLPLMPQLPPYKMYSGYVTVSEENGRALFYYFAESQRDPVNDPVLVWLQGGPGCSSLVGMMTENGPLRATLNADNQLEIVENPWSWNRFANTLYIESPAGVGFSYSNTTSDYNTNNNKTAADNYQFLIGFFQKFPQFTQNKIWIAGESYGGVYVPDLAATILREDDSMLKENLLGFSVGNPVFSCEAWKFYQNNQQINLFYWHGLIPLASYNQWFAECGSSSNTDHCNSLLNNITSLIGNFDPDNLYTNFFTGNSSLGVGPVVSQSLWDLRNTWLNMESVQAALHVFNTSTVWGPCCAEVGQEGTPCALNYTNNWTDMLPTYEYFFDKHPQLKILIYSGDTDVATCPHAYAQLCLSQLNRPLVTQWAPWTIPIGANQTAGYSETYDRFTYATVKGAGHEVPQFQPAAAYHMVSEFIASQFP